MSKLKNAALDETFAALSDATRRAILARLALGEATVGELSKPFSLSAPTISKHLRVLERASLIKVRKDAQRRMCRLTPNALSDARDWISDTTGFWSESLDRLQSLATPRALAKKRSY